MHQQHVKLLSLLCATVLLFGIVMIPTPEAMAASYTESSLEALFDHAVNNDIICYLEPGTFVGDLVYTIPEGKTLHVLLDHRDIYGNVVVDAGSTLTFNGLGTFVSLYGVFFGEVYYHTGVPAGDTGYSGNYEESPGYATGDNKPLVVSDRPGYLLYNYANVDYYLPYTFANNTLHINVKESQKDIFDSRYSTDRTNFQLITDNLDMDITRMEVSFKAGLLKDTSAFGLIDGIGSAWISNEFFGDYSGDVRIIMESGSLAINIVDDSDTTKPVWPAGAEVYLGIPYNPPATSARIDLRAYNVDTGETYPAIVSGGNVKTYVPTFGRYDIKVVYLDTPNDDTDWLGTYRVKASSLHVRSKPGMDGKIVGMIPRNSLVNVEEISGKWGRIALSDGSAGWQWLGYLEPLTIASGVYKTLTATTIHKSADITSDAAGFLKKGEEVIVEVPASNGFFTVRSKAGVYGYVYGGDVAYVKQQELPKLSDGQVRITASVADVRSGPDKEYGIVGKLNYGAVVTVSGYSEDGKWMNIGNGYISVDSVK